MSAVQLKAIRESFFTTVFSLLGHIANCDGYINRNEIKRTQVYMDKMKLSAHCRSEAIHLFRSGSSPAFDINSSLEEFKSAAGENPNITQVLLVYLISMARTDGQLVKKEMEVVQKVAGGLGYTSIVFDHLLKIITAQDEFEPPADNDKYQRTNTDYQKHNFKAHVTIDRSAAFRALDISPDASEVEIKKAYRRLVNQFHPDKLVGQGMPPDLVSAATERFRKIQAAYELLQKYRRKSDMT